MTVAVTYLLPRCVTSDGISVHSFPHFHLSRPDGSENLVFSSASFVNQSTSIRNHDQNRNCIKEMNIEPKIVILKMFFILIRFWFVLSLSCEQIFLNFAQIMDWHRLVWTWWVCCVICVLCVAQRLTGQHEKITTDCRKKERKIHVYDNNKNK